MGVGEKAINLGHVFGDGEMSAMGDGRRAVGDGYPKRGLGITLGGNLTARGWAWTRAFLKLYPGEGV